MADLLSSYDMIIYDTIANKNSVILKSKVMAYYTTKNQATCWVKDGLHQFCYLEEQGNGLLYNEKPGYRLGGGRFTSILLS